MPNTDRPVRVSQGNDPTLVFLVSRRKTDRTLEPYPIGGRTWEFFVKADRASPDGVAIPGTPDPAQNTSTASAITVSLTSAQVGEPGTRFCRLDAISAGKRETVGFWPFEVVDV